MSCSNMPNKRVAEASAKVGQQNRLSKEERLAMETWFALQRVYPEGTTGRPMTNLRWINGAGSKGLKTANVDSKDATQSGAHLSLAGWVNRRLTLAKPWTAEIAHTKWKNMKTSFKRIVKEHQFPIESEWEALGKTKEDMATEIERITAIRKSKCASYDVLWAELHNHPSINPAGRLESSQMLDEDDEQEYEAEQDNGNESDEGQEDEETSKGKQSKSSATPSEGCKSPRVTTPTRPAAAARTSPKQKPKPKINKFKFKKSSHAPRHRDITQAYISMKAEWNRMWLRVQVLKERREVYFICRDRGMNSADVKLAFDDIGLGKLPAYLPSWGEDPLNESFRGPPDHDAAHEMRQSNIWDRQRGDGSGSSSSAEDDDEEDDEEEYGSEGN
jgi:hypothetical protein